VKDEIAFDLISVLPRQYEFIVEVVNYRCSLVHVKGFSFFNANGVTSKLARHT